MKVLSIRQPYAGAVALGWKDVENRSQMFSLRGPFLVHAGAQLHADPGAVDHVAGLAGRDVPLFGRPGLPAAWEFGAIVGVASLQSAHRGCDGSCSPWAQPGQVHHLIVDARPLRHPVPCLGRLGAFTPDREVLEVDIATRLGLPVERVEEWCMDGDR